MSEGEHPRPPGSITIDQLLALNAEIAALGSRGRAARARAGGRRRAICGAGWAGSRRPCRGGSIGARACPRRSRARGSRSRRFTARSSRPGHGRASCRSRSRAWRGMSAATPRPAPPSGWRSGIHSWCCRWLTFCSWAWSGWPCRGSSTLSSCSAGAWPLRCAVCHGSAIGAVLVAGRADLAVRALRSPGCGPARRHGFGRGHGAGCGSFPG